MKTIIHVNRHKIKSNQKHGTDEPVLTVKTYKSNTYAHTAQIVCPCCDKVAAEVIHSPEKPLKCGARVWIETQGEVVTA